MLIIPACDILLLQFEDLWLKFIDQFFLLERTLNYLQLF